MAHDPGASGSTERRIGAHCRSGTRAGGRDRHRISAPEYSGPYDITPLFTAQVLPTAKKLMQKDVTIRKIPQYEVANDSSGYTLIIGEEYYNAQ